ncbi:MAG TPA: hypothetical protein VJ875_01850 [Pyrinomonadaceae bacterium]|nr:hypothetical protein [Pyrinomonadaceae bacterium]
MSKYEDANLILKLYDLRREKTMRDARNWFFTFNPQSTKDFIDVLTSDKSGYYRMVVSYWDMAASLVNNGAIDSQMFGDANGEHLFVYAKLEPFIPTLREEMGAPQFLSHLEKVVKETPDYEARLANIRDRMQKLIAIWQQKNAAQAAAASGD